MNEGALGQNADYFLDLLLVAAGGYLIYAAIVMKVTGRIANTLISRNIDPDRAPDKEGYIRRMFIPCIIMGCLMVLCGLFTVIIPRVSLNLPSYAPVALYLFSMGLVIAFGVYSINLQNRYLKNR
ncbi:MAG: hypothetical protein J6P45_06390 [Lachnospiraceae bacterium]|nr:hypothetical protein [Lachnospiraceae bacterium]MBR1875863.1 hypothetical protein [Lachnospiraceae bacterium]